MDFTVSRVVFLVLGRVRGRGEKRFREGRLRRRERGKRYMGNGEGEGRRGVGRDIGRKVGRGRCDRRWIEKKRYW